jgi:DNA-binding NarL/FixJ family response regulator
MADPIRVMIVDDHDVVREGLRSLVQKRPEFALVAGADSVASAIKEAGRAQTDVIIMDVRLPDGMGIDVVERIRSGAGAKDDELSLLSEQELRILDLIADGKTNKETAEVFLSDKTVKNYVSSILSKLDLRRRSEAAAFIARKRENRP